MTTRRRRSRGLGRQWEIPPHEENRIAEAILRGLHQDGVAFPFEDDEREALEEVTDVDGYEFLDIGQIDASTASAIIEELNAIGWKLVRE